MGKIKTIKQKDMVYKSEKRLVSIPYCSICKKELIETGKDYKPYFCDCGDWYWNENGECYEIFE